MAGEGAKGSLSVSMIVGLLVVPLTAAAAMWLGDPAEGGSDASGTTTPSNEIEAATSTTVGQEASDLQVACGAEGMQLVALEQDGSITDVQQAALDALRDLCDQQGLPLPAAPAAEPVVQTVVQQAAPSAPAPPATTATTLDDDDDRDDDEWDDDDWDDDRDDDDDDGDDRDDDDDEDDDDDDDGDDD
jgi:hypothetical protein